MPLPGRALQRFGYECVCVCDRACVYFGEITMGGCVFTLHGKIILLTVWKIDDMSLFLPGSAEPGGGPCGPHGGALTQHQIPLKRP